MFFLLLVILGDVGRLEHLVFKTKNKSQYSLITFCKINQVSKVVSKY